MEIKAQESVFEKAHIQEGIHPAELFAVSDTPDGQYGPRVALDFWVYYGKKERPVKIGRIFGKKLSPKSKLWEALTALGAELEVGKKVDTNELLGRFCRVVVEDYIDNDGNTVSGITKVKEADDETGKFIVEVKEKYKEDKEENKPVSVTVEEVE